jgi:hypothetical protein
MPHLWTFLLKSLTPPAYEVFPIDGKAQPMPPRWNASDVVRAVRGPGHLFSPDVSGALAIARLEEPPPPAKTLLRGVSGSAGAR